MKRREFLALLAAVALARPKAAAAQGRQVRIGVLRLWRPKSVSRYAVKAPARAKMRRCSGRISDLPRSIFPAASRRFPMMHRDGWDGPRATNAMAFAWFVWDARHEGPPQLGFFDWKQFQTGT